jgi:CheY-like chemotaxis protein
MIVEDQSVIATWLQLRLERMGYTVLDTAADTEQALAKAGILGPDLILMDVHLGGGSDGIAAAKDVRDRHGIPVILITGSADDATLRRAREAGVDGFIQKPFDERQLHTAIQTALCKRRLELAQSHVAGAGGSGSLVDEHVQALLHKLNNELAVATAILALLQEGHLLPVVPLEQVRTAQGRLTAAAQVTAQLQRAVQAPKRREPPAAAASAPEPADASETAPGAGPTPIAEAADAAEAPPAVPEQAVAA